LDIHSVNFKNSKALCYWLLVIFYLNNRETSKGWVCDNFPRQFHFFSGCHPWKAKFKYFKIQTVKVCSIWCNDVYMSILQCDTWECCWINMKYLAYLNILFGDNHVQNSGNCKKGDPWGPPWYFKSDEKHSCRLISTKKCHTEE
jgi:hypothetical protein